MAIGKIMMKYYEALSQLIVLNKTASRHLKSKMNTTFLLAPRKEWF